MSKLSKLYAKIPEVKGCQKGCSDCCGPVPMSSAEAGKVRHLLRPEVYIVGDFVTPKDRKRKFPPRNKLDVRKVEYILNSRLNSSQIARELGVHRTTLSLVRHRKIWSHVDV